MPGLTAWQGLFAHGRLQAGQSVLVHGGRRSRFDGHSARTEAGGYVIGTGRAPAVDAGPRLRARRSSSTSRERRP